MSKSICFPKPQPKQVEFCKSRARFTCYGGARGGGKSWVIRFKAKLLALHYAGIRICIVRKTLEDLRKNHIVPLQLDADNEMHGLMTYSSKERAFLFPNGSRIELNFHQRDSDETRWQGQAFDVIFLEEATQLTEEHFNIIRMCNRRSDTITVPFHSRMYLTCNPGGPGHGWVKRLFIDRDYRNQERPEDYVFIQALLTDNPFLMKNDPEYMRMLENLPEAQRRAMLYGEWDVFDGQFFPEFLTSTHVCQPFDIPSGWRKYRAFDYGFDMFACYWIAVDYDGRAWVYREYTEGIDMGDGHQGLIISEAAKVMTDQSDNADIFQTFAPPDMWNKRQETGRSAADIFASCGVYLSKAGNNRIQGWQDLKEWLKLRPDGKPGIVVFDTCKQLISSMQLILHDEKKVDDVAKEPHNITHSPDALRYFVAGHPVAPLVPLPEEEHEELWRESSEWDEINDFEF